MSNFYTDNQDLLFTLKNLELEEVVAVREHDYTDAQKYDGSPVDYADAMDILPASGRRQQHRRNCGDSGGKAPLQNSHSSPAMLDLLG